MPTHPARLRYRSYLLRFWQDSGDPSGEWRFSLEDPHTGVRQGFADLNHLLAFINGTINQSAGPRSAPDHER